MSENQQPYGDPAPEPKWDLVVDGDQVTFVAGHIFIPLGSKEAAFEKMAQVMAAEDFGER